MINLISMVHNDAAEPSGGGDVETGTTIDGPSTPPSTSTRRAVKDEGDESDPPSPKDSARNKELQARLREVTAQVAAGLKNMQVSMQALREQHDADMQATRADEMESLHAQMRSEMQGASSLAAKLKQMVDQVAGEKSRFDAAGSGSARQHATVVMALRTKLARQLREFLDLRVLFEADHRAILARRYAAVTGHPPSDDELRRLAGDATRDAAESVFQSALRSRANEVFARAAMAEVRERHEAIVDIERSMEQLHQMCLDLAALVSDQGDMVDSIEAHVQHSVAYVERGRHHVKQARRLQRRIRTRMLLSTFALAAVITLVVVAVAIPTAIHFG